MIYGILIAGLWQGTGLVMCLMLAGLRGIDEDIWKAARVDGIPTWKTYLFIVIPMMRPVFITTLVIIAAGIVKLYDLVVAQTSGGPGHRLRSAGEVCLRQHVPGAEPRPGLCRLDHDAADRDDRRRALGLSRIRRQAQAWLIIARRRLPGPHGPTPQAAALAPQHLALRHADRSARSTTCCRST